MIQPPPVSDHKRKTPRTIARVNAIDVLRGAVMILMAIDHVRVYSGLPAGGSSPGIFFTRWVTHFAAPAFAFFAGTSAFLYGLKLNDKKKLAGFLLTRGLLLVVLELTLIRFGWSFNFDYSNFMLAGVIWMLGWCMILLSALISLRASVVGIIGLVIIFGQQLFKLVPQAFPPNGTFARFWEFIYTSGSDGPNGIAVLYVIVPWIGVMAAGYGFGKILLLEPARKRKICLWIGLSAIALWVIIGSIIILRQPSPADARPFIFRLLNQNKYPASQLFLLMTLGPIIALIPFAEKAKGWLANVCAIFGRVPFFYYFLHIPLIHLSALLVNYIKEGTAHQEWYVTAPFTSVPPEYQWNLALLYVEFIIDVAILYLLCRWYAKYKLDHPDRKWLKYI